MILVLGGRGYVSRAFQSALTARGLPYRAVSRTDANYSEFGVLRALLHETRPQFVINAAGKTGRPNVDQCEVERAETIAGNITLPITVRHACEVARVPLAHVSSGCIYTGVKIVQSDGGSKIGDLGVPSVRKLAEEQPQLLQGFTEEDLPNFSFRSPPCSFYSGTKALAEEALAGYDHAYVWRLRIPFDEQSNERNYLTKLLTYDRVYDNVNSLSHLGDFVNACLDLWALAAPFGIYNVTNPGFVSTRRVIELLAAAGRISQPIKYWEGDRDFYQFAKAPRSNCILDVTKLQRAGVRIRPVEDALQDAIRRWAD